MFGCFKNLFSRTDNSALTEAIHNGAFLVDVRTPEEFASGSVEGAVNIPLHEIGMRLDEFENKETIIVFCRSGGRSAQAFNILQKNGFSNVLDGGPWTKVHALKSAQ